MPTKPTDLVRFAVNGADADASNISAPSSGTRDTGFPSNAILTSANFNYFTNKYYRWLQYLNAGAFQGASSFDSTLSITGLLSALSGLLLGTNQNLTLQGTGDLKHGPREIVIPGSAFIALGNNVATAPSFAGTNWTFGTPPNDVIEGPSRLRTGDRILSITWFFNKVSNSSTMTMKLLTRNGTTMTDRDTLSDSSSGASFTSVPRSSINYTLAAGDAAALNVQAGSNVHKFSHAVISYDHP